MAAVGATSISVAPASANPVAFKKCVEEFFMSPPRCLPIKATLSGFKVSGSLTAGGQVQTLPAGATFNGVALLECRPCEGGVTGEIDGGATIPPYTAEIEFPKGSGEHQVAAFTLRELIPNSVLGSVTSTSPANCPAPIVGSSATCVNEKVPLQEVMTVSLHGPGNGSRSKEVTNCETVTPIALLLDSNLTLLEIVVIGTHFEGTDTIPAFTCSGKHGNGTQEQLTEDLSGPGTYSINVNPPV